MNASDHRFVHRHASLGFLGRALAQLDPRAPTAGREPALALSPRVAIEDLGTALEHAFGLMPALRARLHLFAADLSLDPECPPRGGLQALRGEVGLTARQLHLPEAGGDLLKAARAYEADIRAFFRLAAGDTPAFDAVLLAPEDLRTPRCPDACERLATGVYDVSTGRSSVSLTVASLARASAAYCIGHGAGEADAPALPRSLASRLCRVRWDCVPTNLDQEKSR